MATKIVQSLFDIKNLPDDAQKVLRDFDQIAQAAMPANSKQLVALPKIIRELSHQMTDDRGSRRLGYMNEKNFFGFLRPLLYVVEPCPPCAPFFKP